MSPLHISSKISHYALLLCFTELTLNIEVKFPAVSLLSDLILHLTFTDNGHMNSLSKTVHSLNDNIGKNTEKLKHHTSIMSTMYMSMINPNTVLTSTSMQSLDILHNFIQFHKKKV